MRHELNLELDNCHGKPDKKTSFTAFQMCIIIKTQEVGLKVSVNGLA